MHRRTPNIRFSIFDAYRGGRIEGHESLGLCRALAPRGQAEYELPVVSFSVETLERSIARQDHRSIVDHTRGMTEPQRARWSREASALAELLVLRGTSAKGGARYRRIDELDARLARHLPKPNTHRDSGREIPRGMDFCADVARYALCDERALPQTADYDGERAQVIVEVLLDRRPTWLARWLTTKLAADVQSQVISWQITRGLARAGVLQRPLPDGYFQLLASPWTRATDGDQSPADLLLADRDLLVTDVWELFERDTRAFRRDANWDPSWDWADALARLSEREVDRARLLDATLRALAAPFRAATHRGLIALHAKLDPTDAERATRRTLYAALEGHSLAAVRALAAAPKRRAKGAGRANAEANSSAKSRPKTVVPPPPAPWPPRWKSLKPSAMAPGAQPVGAVFTYRAGPFLCFAVKIADNRWLEPSGLGANAEREALEDWRAMAASPPRARSMYLDDATVLVRASLEPSSLKRAV